MIENNLKDNTNNNYLALQEEILSFFEKNSLIYLENILKDRFSRYIDEKIPLEIFEYCVNFLYIYNFTDKLDGEIKHIIKLYCIGYIKAYCYTFIKMIEKKDKWKKL